MMKTGEEILALLGGQAIVRDYLRGVDPESEMDRDAKRSMMAAIASASAAGIHPAMAAAEPALYAQYCLLKCGQWTDAESAAADSLTRQAYALALQLRYDERNTPEEGGAE